MTLSDRGSFPRSAEDEERTKNVWMKGHTDSGTVSLLWNQPVIALQIMCPDGKWRYVRYVPNSIVSTSRTGWCRLLDSVPLPP